MRLLILDEGYPHLDHLMGDVFVHVRAKEYAKKHEVKAFSFFHAPRQLEYEGIPLEMFDNIPALVKAIAAYNPDKILIHFYQSWMLEKVIKVFKVPVIIWVHGYEALGWYRRLFNFKWYTPVLLNYINKNTRQQYHFRKLIQYANQTDNIQFVFVSKWMKKITEQDTLSKIKRADIIHNPIDVSLFQPQYKDEAQRANILILRSFSSRKYANDLSVKAIEILSKRPIFNYLNFKIIGKGQLFDKTLAPINNYKNITIQKGAVQQVSIPEVHRQYGIFLCPTRQDAQGVSMCEAMSSGLVPITSNNTAIPEFVTDKQSGFLTNSPKEIADAIERLYHDPKLFQQIASNAATSIRQLCNIESITQKELTLIEK